MELIGKITASLAEAELSALPELLKVLNGNIHPPEILTGDDVHIRALYVVSDQVNSHGGCFPPDEHPKLMQLLVDSPVLVGHRKDSLPIARNFHAEAVVRDGANWIKVYFYWLKDSDFGENLKRNIDGGIYKEGSISFIFKFPECSICGSDMRECRHHPFVSYDVEGGGKREAYFNYRGIEKVLETSLVYRGSVADTEITRELAFSKTDDTTAKKSVPEKNSEIKRIWNVGVLDPKGTYLVRPAYESLPVTLTGRGDEVFLHDGQGRLLIGARVKSFLSQLNLAKGDYALDGRLIGYRGKARQKVRQLCRYLEGGESTVRRLELKVCDFLWGAGGEEASDGRTPRHTMNDLLGGSAVAAVPFQITGGSELSSTVQNISSRIGAEITCLESGERYFFSHRKVLSALVIGRRGCDERAKYRLGLKIGPELVPVGGEVTAGDDVHEGDVIEIEVAGLRRSGSEIELIMPRPVDFPGPYGRLQDLSLLDDAAGDFSGLYYLAKGGEKEQYLILIPDQNRKFYFRLHGFVPELLQAGRRFLADQCSETISADRTEQGRLESFEDKEGIISFEAGGVISGACVICPVRIGGIERRLFYCPIKHAAGGR